MRNKLFILPISLFVLIFIIELIFIISINDGNFVYTLDDAYVHLSLAQNIAHGHYGINAFEYSAPSSSIIWPFILAPFANFSLGLFFPLALNLFFGVIVLIVSSKILEVLFGAPESNKEFFVHNLFLLMFIIAFNLTGLVFTGMEHVLQLLIILLTFREFLRILDNEKVSKFFLFLLVIGPLVRFENLAVSMPAVIFLLFISEKKKGLTLLAVLLASLILFCAFLFILGLDPIPASVLIKSSPISSGGSFAAITDNLINNLFRWQGITLFCVVALMISGSLSSARKGKERVFFLTISGSIILHLLFGRFGWLHRYEIYIWAFSLFGTLYLLRTAIKKLTEDFSIIYLLGLVSALTILFCRPYVTVLFTTPLQSNNIYLQQFQMHRFLVNYYPKPAAVNDVGLVSHDNDNYILDLWGLTSESARKYRQISNSPDWMNEICVKNNVKIAMIYENWFNAVPGNWEKVGELVLLKKKRFIGGDKVSFYAIGNENFGMIARKVKEFKSSLPDGAQFIFEKKTNLK